MSKNLRFNTPIELELELELEIYISALVSSYVDQHSKN